MIWKKENMRLGFEMQDLHTTRRQNVRSCRRRLKELQSERDKATTEHTKFQERARDIEREMDEMMCKMREELHETRSALEREKVERQRNYIVPDPWAEYAARNRVHQLPPGFAAGQPSPSLQSPPQTPRSPVYHAPHDSLVIFGKMWQGDMKFHSHDKCCLMDGVRTSHSFDHSSTWRTCADGITRKNHFD